MKISIARLAIILLITCYGLVCAKERPPFQPLPILPGGEILPLYPPDSRFLKTPHLHEAEQYNTATGNDKGPITNVINIHNPSIEIHLVGKDTVNTGTAVILAPGGGHQILWVGPEGAEYVPFFAKLGVSTIILRNRLRVDGYDSTTDAVNDALQAIRLVRSRAAQWSLDPNRIGIIGFSAGAELSAPAALLFEEFGKNKDGLANPLAKISARPDFVGVIYPGPTPFTKNPSTAIPPNMPPSFIACAGAGDQVHALWATDYFTPLLKAGIPNLEMHIYGRGTHGVSATDRETIPYGKWRERYVEWFRDLGFLDPAGTKTKAAIEIEEYIKARSLKNK